MQDFKIDGFTDSHTECDRCGKKELKGTYHITTSTGEMYHLGSSCIKKAYQMTQKEFTAKVDSDFNERFNLARAEWRTTPEYKALESHNERKYINGFYTSQRDIDREVSLNYASRFYFAAQPVLKAIGDKYNVPSFKL